MLKKILSNTIVRLILAVLISRTSGWNENGEHYTKVKIRTILTCRSGNGICAKCYGANMSLP